VEGLDYKAFLPPRLPARNGILIASLPRIPISWSNLPRRHSALRNQPTRLV
jgi:hypothetical protein